MSASTRTETITDPRDPTLRMALELPNSWVPVTTAEKLPPEVIAAFSDDRQLTPGFTTNVLVIAQDLPRGLDLVRWQEQSRAHQASTLPDLQIFDDRLLEEAPVPTWYRARVITGAGPATQLVREWSRTAGPRGVTLTLTTVPPVDAEHAELLDSIAASWMIAPEEEQP